MKKNQTPAVPATSRTLAASLLGIAVVETLLSVYQWFEYVQLRRGNVPACNVNETINCGTVWTSSLAVTLNNILGVPVAALGLVWGLGAVVVTWMLFDRLRRGQDTGNFVTASRLFALAGVIAVVVFAGESLRVRAVCITCLITYTLTLLFAVLAWKVSARPLMAQGTERKGGLGWSIAAALGAYILALVVANTTGTATAKKSGTELLADAATKPVSANVPQTEADKKLAEYFAGLPGEDRQLVANAVTVFKMTPARMPQQNYPVRKRWGPENAPMRLVEWTDMACGHCATLVETVSMLKKVVPEGSMSVEPRQFPLDSECNPLMQRSDGQGMRCAGAKAQICLEGAPDFWELREKMFAAQRSLTREKVLEIASSGSMSRKDLEACIASPETNKKLLEDIFYANVYEPSGTPIAVVNGREAWPVGPFLYSLAVTKVNPTSPAYSQLPPHNLQMR